MGTSLGILAAEKKFSLPEGLLGEIYKQPPRLCGLMCLLAARDWIVGLPSLSVPRFDECVTISKELLSQSDQDDPEFITLAELIEVATKLGLKATRCSLSFKGIVTPTATAPRLLVVKMQWFGNETIHKLDRNFKSVGNEQSDHYVLFWEEYPEYCSGWEPSFSGPNNTPLIYLTWEEIIRGNLNLKYASAECGEAIAISL